MRGRILIIDDDHNVRDVLSCFLEGLGFEVIQAVNGSSVMPLVREHRPDLIVCDLVMPGISGIQVLKQVKLEFPAQPVLMMSGIQEEEVAREALDLGALDYLTKPVSLETLETKFINPMFDRSG